MSNLGATATDSTSGLSPGAIAGIVVAALLALIALALLLWFLFRPSEPACKQYSLADIQQATNLFSEVKAMARLQHPALVPLLGYCIDYNETSRQMEQITVSQFMPNGDLSHRTSPEAKPISNSQPPHLPIPPPHTSQATAELSSSDVSSIIDPRMASPAASTSDVSMVHADVLQSLASLALACTVMPAASRPSMAKVLSQLKQLHEEVVRREGDSGLEQGSGFVGVDMGVGGVGGMAKEKWESPADGASAVSVTPVTAVRDTICSLEGNESSSGGEGTSGEASGSVAGYHN
ncbi:unnamed protein product [Closterium sp. Naga37s-1]|nr:unnamed protein product [Closterium sp. Naga37s-1]